MVKLIIEWPNGLPVSDIVRVEKLVSKTGGKGLFVAPGSASHNSASPKCNHDMHWREQYICAKCGYVSISHPRGCGCTSGE